MAKKFIAYKSHPMMGAASTGTGANGFFSFFIEYHPHTDLSAFQIFL
jgi:hypothetical protein